MYPWGDQLLFLPKMLLNIIGLLTEFIVSEIKNVKKKGKGKRKTLIHPGKERFEYKSDVPVIAADLTRCHYHNSFHLSTAGVLTHGGEMAFSWVSGTQ